MIFRILETKTGTYLTNRSYFLCEIEELIEQTDLNERFGWLFKEKSNLQIEHEDNFQLVIKNRMSFLNSFICIDLKTPLTLSCIMVKNS